MSHLNIGVSPLVSEKIALLKDLDLTAGVLDLACGNGRNGLFLLQHHIPVTFADNNAAALQDIERRITRESVRGRTWLVDLETDGDNPLAGNSFDAILVFNYLHRPRLPAIRDAVRPGGLVFYETFTEKQGQFGRPKNPDFLLKEEELREAFQSWQFLHYFEGERTAPHRAIASLIARKPQ